MIRRRSHNHLQDWEIAIVKAMFEHTGKNDQTILAYFTRPNRSINHRLISQIRKGVIHKGIVSVSKDDMEIFISNYPFIDWDTGLHIYADELLIKAREAMLNAVQTYNNPKTHFRAEIFIVSAIIAWTYMLHALFKREGIDYLRYKKDKITIQKTAQGSECFLGLQDCLDKKECKVDEVVKKNLELLIIIRNEIEHRCTQQIDTGISPQLQSCCTNFNDYIKKHFGHALGLDKELSFALQFAHISLEQEKNMILEKSLPSNVKLAQNQFEANMSEEHRNDPRYAIRVNLFNLASNNKNKAEQSFVLVPADSPEAKVEGVGKILLKTAEPVKYKPKAIVTAMNAAGFLNFGMHQHTTLKRKFKPQHPHKAKDKGGNYGIWIGNEWFYYERWLDRIKTYCHEHGTEKFSFSK